jgi:hypothetical protein
MPGCRILAQDAFTDCAIDSGVNLRQFHLGFIHVYCLKLVGKILQSRPKGAAIAAVIILSPDALPVRLERGRMVCHSCHSSLMDPLPAARYELPEKELIIQGFTT